MLRSKTMPNATDDGESLPELLDSESLEALAGPITDGYESKDPDIIRSMSHPDALFWSSLWGQTQTLDEHCARRKANHVHIKEERIVDIRRLPTPEGFVTQQVVQLTLQSGEELRIPNCAIFTMEDGLIKRMDEYINILHVLPLIRRMVSSGMSDLTGGRLSNDFEPGSL